MRISRYQIGMRGGSILVAMIGIGFGIAREFMDGLPPRFVFRGIPARIARLKPGMTHAQVHEIMGLDRSWMLGGTSARFTRGMGNGGTRGPWISETYEIGETKLVDPTATVGGVTGPTAFYRPRGRIQIFYKVDVPVGTLDWGNHFDKYRLTKAQYHGEYDSAKMITW